MKKTGTLAAPVRAALLASVALFLAGCEVRRDGDSAEPEPAPVPTENTEPAPATTTSAASIIRDDIEPEIPVVVPPEPISLVVPFPDGPDLTPAAERVLVTALESAAMREGWPVRLGGHTDSSGNDQANLRAARSRAEAVAAWLVEHGVADERIEVVAFGEQNPIAPNALPDGTPNEQGRRTNRRVELRVAPAARAGSSEPDEQETVSSQREEA